MGARRQKAKKKRKIKKEQLYGRDEAFTFLRRELAEFKKDSYERYKRVLPFTKSKERLMERFPQLSEAEAEKIARDFEDKHFLDVLGMRDSRRRKEIKKRSAKRLKKK